MFFSHGYMDTEGFQLLPEMCLAPVKINARFPNPPKFPRPQHIFDSIHLFPEQLIYRSRMKTNHREAMLRIIIGKGKHGINSSIIYIWKQHFVYALFQGIRYYPGTILVELRQKKMGMCID